MKVTLLSTFDKKGGAAIAAYRLHQALRQQGTDSSMIVREKLSSDPHVFGPQGKLAQGYAKTRGVIDALPLQAYRHRDQQANFFPQWLPNRLDHALSTLAPNVINLHWISGGFIPVEALARWDKKWQIPLVWTLHDLWPMTGGCHYPSHFPEVCDRFQQTCGACPQLGSQRDRDLSRWVLKRKARSWKNLPLHIVSPSRWLADLAHKSSLFRDAPIDVIPNGLDLELYRPIARQTAREILRLPLQGQLVLFGADNALADPRKGFQFLKPTLARLASLSSKRPVEIAVFGADAEMAEDFPYRIHCLGKLQDATSLVLAYAAADVFLLPSVQDNLPNTIIEALACGTPCAGFRQGGMSDMIQHLQNGFLARPYDTDELATGLHWILENLDRHKTLCEQARRTAMQNFSQTQQAQRYRALFERLAWKN